jgi:hypothetical protein
VKRQAVRVVQAVSTVRIASALWLVGACAGSSAGPSVRAPTSPDAEEAPGRPIATSLAQDPLAEVAASPQFHQAHQAHQAHQTTPEAASYTCPMHPEVVQAQPGTCPKCGMQLVPKEPGGQGASTETPHAH